MHHVPCIGLQKYCWRGINNELSDYILTMMMTVQKVVLREFGSYQGSGAPIPQGRLGGRSFRYPRVGNPKRMMEILFMCEEHISLFGFGSGFLYCSVNM